MEFEDSTKALFAEPNAYLQNCKPKKQTKKIVFQQPYECIPNYYINNNFEKRGCNYCDIKKQHKPNKCEPKCDCKKSNGKGFDLKQFLPLFGGMKNFNLSSITSMLGGNSNGFLSGLLGNENLLSNIANIFSSKPNKAEKKEINQSDIDIENYTKVE